MEAIDVAKGTEGNISTTSRHRLSSESREDSPDFLDSGSNSPPLLPLILAIKE